MSGIKKEAWIKPQPRNGAKFKMTQAKSYRCERDLKAAESKISKQTQVKFHYAAEWNFILGKWLLEENETALIRF
jgi:hypothetical protein